MIEIDLSAKLNHSIPKTVMRPVSGNQTNTGRFTTNGTRYPNGYLVPFTFSNYFPIMTNNGSIHRKDLFIQELCEFTA